jgi:gliding motility-associated-like protein
LSGPDPTVTPNATTTYTVTTTLGTCVFTREILVVVYDAVLTVPPDTTICAGETITLTASGTLTGPFVWVPGGSNPNGASTMVTPASTTSYHVTYSYGNGNCTLEDSVLVTVAPLFELEIMADPDSDSVIVGTPIDLTAIVAPTQSLADFGFSWTENNNPVGTGETITVTPTTNADSANFFYTVQAVSPAGCVRSATYSVLVIKPKAQFPNVFTPNGDGANDVFRMVVPEGTATVDRMEIYSRWGEKIFESSEPQAAWDGRIDGKEAPSEVYVYLVWWRTADGALQPLERGDVTLLR